MAGGESWRARSTAGTLASVSETVGAPAPVYSRAVAVHTDPKPIFEQGDQPPGVPPLALTGERTLPDVPEENYWFRRHLAVYEWIAARVARAARDRHGLRRGLRRRTCSRASASEVVGVDANPEAHEHARLRYRRANLRFARDLVETYSAPADAVVFLQTIEHLQDPAGVLGALPLAGRIEWERVRVHAQRADARARGGGTLGQSLARARVPRRSSSSNCVAARSPRCRCTGSIHARQLRGARAGVARGLGLGPSPAGADETVLRPLHPGDRALGLRVASRRAWRIWTGRWTSSRSAGRDRSASCVVDGRP